MADRLARMRAAVCFSPVLGEGGEAGGRISLFAGRNRKRYFCCTALAFVIVLAPLGAIGEELPDPTRPPPGILTFPEGGRAGSPSSALQSVIISKDRRAAIIDGETVELGGKYGDAKLIEVNEGNVVLQGMHGRQVLSMFPDVKITGKKMQAKLPSRAGSGQGGKRQVKPTGPGEGS
ncbi:MAG TPA: hypothetical protein VFK88_02940 [Gallionella sp.]|nr:hypothetical protein [Gallionella sp.]